MLPTDLLISRRRYGGLVPHRLALDDDSLALASELIALFTAAVGQRRAELDETLAAFEGEDTAFKVKRGLAHILQNDFATFETVSPVDPPELRRRVFALGASAGPPSRARRDALLCHAADALALEKGSLVTPTELHAGLFADLPSRQVMTAFEPPAPDALVHRFNLAQAQGVFYRAHELVITAHRNTPARYKQLFRYVKLFGLMTLIEGDADHGFTLRVDGPASLFEPSTRYGLAMAKLLPALLHVTKWSLRASLKRRPPPDRDTNRVREDETPPADTFELAAGCGLVSHYAPGQDFDSVLEEAFAARWAKLDTPWTLEREVDLVPVPGSAIIPDFRVAHPDGRSVLVEIVGYWRPEYLRKKFALLRQAGRRDLVLAVSERLNLAGAGVNPDEFRDRIVWFKGKLDPKAVLERVEAILASLPAPVEVKKETTPARRSTRKPPPEPAP